MLDQIINIGTDIYMICAMPSTSRYILRLKFHQYFQIMVDTRVQSKACIAKRRKAVLDGELTQSSEQIGLNG